MDQYQNKLLIRPLFKSKYKVKKEKPIKSPKKNNMFKYFKYASLNALWYIISLCLPLPKLYQSFAFVIYNALYIAILSSQIYDIIEIRRKKK